jgi:four helix bundle protein
MDDLDVLRLTEMVSDEIWNIVNSWPPFARKSVGTQWVRAVDSIGANIAEAYGRYHYGEKIHFLYFARGSVFETKYWLNRSLSRGLKENPTTITMGENLSEIARQVNAFTNSLKTRRGAQQSKNIRDESIGYNSERKNPIFSEKDIESLASIFNH